MRERATAWVSLLLVLPLVGLVTACTPGQLVGAGMMGVGGTMAVAGFTEGTSCTRDRPCYQGAQPITSGVESNGPRSVPVGIIGAALVVAGAVVVVAYAAPSPKVAATPPGDPRSR